MTFAATLFSAFFMVGVPGFAYTHGVGVWPYLIFGDVLGLIALYYVGKKFVERQSWDNDGKPIYFSPLDMFCPNIFTKCLVLAVLVVFMVPYLSVQISGFGKLIESTTSGAVSAVFAATITLFVIWMYSSISGIKGVVYSDVIQGVLLFSGAILVGSLVIFYSFSGPVDLLQQVAAKKPELLSAPGPKGIFTEGALFSTMIMFAALPITQIQFLTRYLMLDKKNAHTQLKSIIVGMAFLMSVVSLFILFSGLGGAIIVPDATGGDKIFGLLLGLLLPISIAMLVNVAVLAAAMSTADSILFSISQVFVGVAGSKAKSGAERTSLLIAARILILAVGLVALMFGLSNSQLIVSLSKLTFAGTLQLAPAILGGLWFPHAWRYAGALSIISGFAVFLGLRWSEIQIFWGLDPAIIGLAVALCAFLLTFRIKNS